MTILVSEQLNFYQICTYVRTYVATYGTNHPQLKQSTRVTRVPHVCCLRVTRVCFSWRGMLFSYTRVWVHMYTHTKFYTRICLHAHKVFSYTRLGVLFAVLVSHSMYILHSKHICFVSVVPLFFLYGYLLHCYAVGRAT